MNNAIREVVATSITGVVTLGAVVGAGQRGLLVVFVEIWAGVATLCSAIFPRAAVFDDLTIR